MRSCIIEINALAPGGARPRPRPLPPCCACADPPIVHTILVLRLGPTSLPACSSSALQAPRSRGGRGLAARPAAAVGWRAGAHDSSGGANKRESNRADESSLGRAHSARSLSESAIWTPCENPAMVAAVTLRCCRRRRQRCRCCCARAPQGLHTAWGQEGQGVLQA